MEEKREHSRRWYDKDPILKEALELLDLKSNTFYTMVKNLK